MGASAPLGESEYETLGRIAAVDVLLNNADRLPVMFGTEVLTAYCLLLTAYCLLLTTHCSLLTTYYLLLTTH